MTPEEGEESALLSKKRTVAPPTSGSGEIVRRQKARACSIIRTCRQGSACPMAEKRAGSLQGARSRPHPWSGRSAIAIRSARCLKLPCSSIHFCKARPWGLEVDVDAAHFKGRQGGILFSTLRQIFSRASLGISSRFFCSRLFCPAATRWASLTSGGKNGRGRALFGSLWSPRSPKPFGVFYFWRGNE